MSQFSPPCNFSGDPLEQNTGNEPSVQETHLPEMSGKGFSRFFYDEGLSWRHKNRSDHGGRKQARNHSAAEIAGFFASAVAKNR